MRRNKIGRSLLTIMAFASITGLLAGCSGKSGVDNNTLVIGMECNYQPFNWTAKESSDFTLPINGTSEHADGYDIAIAKYLSEDTGLPVVIKRIEWAGLIPGLQNNEINMVLAGMTDTAERRESIDFTDPYLESDLAFLIKTENMPQGYGTKENPATYEQLLDLFDGKSLICQSSVVGDGFIEDYFTNNNAGKTIKHNDPLATYPLAANDVKQGTSFAMPAESPVCEAMESLGGLSTLYCDKSFLSEEDQVGLTVSIGIKKGNSELEEILNTSLAKLSNDQRGVLMGEAAQRSASNA